MRDESDRKTSKVAMRDASQMRMEMAQMDLIRQTTSGQAQNVEAHTCARSLRLGPCLCKEQGAWSMEQARQGPGRGRIYRTMLLAGVGRAIIVVHIMF